MRIGLFGVVTLLLLAGCNPMDEMGKSGRGRHPGDIGRVQRGMTETEVIELVGPPLDQVQGEALNISNSVWVYPKGNIHFRRLVVVGVAEGEAPAVRGATPLDTVTQKYLQRVPIHGEDEDWYKEDQRQDDKKDMERKSRGPLIRPSVPRNSNSK